MTRWMAVLACAVLSPWMAAAQERQELDLDHALTTRFSTPHTQWATPYARGKTRVLFFTNGRGTQPRQCVELMQRFDLEAEAVFWIRVIDTTEEQWHGGKLGEERMEELLRQQWDCFVLFGLTPERLEARAQYLMLQAVSEGAGLVLVGGRDERVLKEKNRLATPEFLADCAGVDVYSVLSGRAVALPTPSEIAYGEGWEVRYDYQAERLGRALLWAAGREPEVRLALQVEVDPVVYGSRPRLTAALTGAVPADGELALRVRAPAREVQDLGTFPIPDDHRVRVQLPLLPAGAHHVDAWVRGPGGVITWSTLPFTVVASRGVEAVELARDWGEVGQHIRGRVRLTGTPLAAEEVQVRLLDRRRRVLQVARVAAGEVRFDFPVTAWLPMLVTVEARVLSRGREVDRAYAYYNVTRRYQGRFNFVMWDIPRGTLAPFAEASLAAHGVTVQLGGQPPRICAAYDVAWIPYTTRIQADVDSAGITQPFCWSDSAAVSQAVRSAVESYGDSRRHGVFVWSLGDEVATRGSCLSPHCARAYQRYLEEQYGTLSALNASWGTDFSAWDQVGLAEPADNEELGSLRHGNYPRWFDRQAFRSWNFVHLCDQYRHAYEAIDPQAKVGFEGAGSFAGGDDLDLIVRHNTFWAPYPGTADEVIRSIAPRDFPRANWMGYAKDADALLTSYWRMVTRGADAVWWWRWDALGRFHGWLAPDLSPYPAVEEILADTWFMREGVGDLLLRYHQEDDGIAILYSYPSSLVSSQDSGGSYGDYEDAHLAAQSAVRELGLQFRYVTARMLRQGEFAARRYRVLLLPRAEALSAAAAKVIRDFVSDGGLVIADVRPGIFNAHLKPRAHGILDELFGIRRRGRPAADLAMDAAFGAVDMKVDPAVEAGAGTPTTRIGGHPVLIHRRVGRGRVILLNFDFSSYPNLAVPETDEIHARRLATWLQDQGISASIQVVDAEGARERDLEITRWTQGEATVFSLFRGKGRSSSQVTVALSRPMEVYDIRQRRSLGRVREFATRILPGRAAFFSVLPARDELGMTLARPRVSRGELAQVSLVVTGATGLHALRLRVDAGDKALEWLTRNVLAGARPVEVTLPVAWNDPRGAYRLEATDLLTGKTATVTLQVR